MEVTNRCLLSSRAPPHSGGSVYHKNREVDQTDLTPRSVRLATTWRCFAGTRLPHGLSDFSAVSALGATADMRITPDLLQRSRKKSLHTFHKKKLVPHFSISLHSFSKSPICVLTRFWTQIVRYGAVAGLRMLPIDSPSNSSLNGMFASHFRKRYLAKIEKNQKISPVAYEIQAGKKIAT